MMATAQPDQFGGQTIPPATQAPGWMDGSQCTETICFDGGVSRPFPHNRYPSRHYPQAKSLADLRAAST
jgi:hypothetical protein